MNLNRYTEAELQMELRRRKGAQWLVDRISKIVIFQEHLSKLDKAIDLLQAKKENLLAGGTFDGSWPVVEEAEDIVSMIKEASFEL